MHRARGAATADAPERPRVTAKRAQDEEHPVHAVLMAVVASIRSCEDPHKLRTVAVSLMPSRYAPSGKTASGESLCSHREATAGKHSWPSAPAGGGSAPFHRAARR